MFLQTSGQFLHFRCDESLQVLYTSFPPILHIHVRLTKSSFAGRQGHPLFRHLIFQDPPFSRSTPRPEQRKICDNDICFLLCGLIIDCCIMTDCFYIIKSASLNILVDRTYFIFGKISRLYMPASLQAFLPYEWLSLPGHTDIDHIISFFRITPIPPPA